MQNDVRNLDVCVDESLGVEVVQAGEGVARVVLQVLLVLDGRVLLVDQLLEVERVIAVLHEQHDVLVRRRVVVELNDIFVVQLSVDAALLLRV